MQGSRWLIVLTLVSSSKTTQKAAPLQFQEWDNSTARTCSFAPCPFRVKHHSAAFAVLWTTMKTDLPLFHVMNAHNA